MPKRPVVSSSSNSLLEPPERSAASSRESNGFPSVCYNQRAVPKKEIDPHTFVGDAGPAS